MELQTALYHDLLDLPECEECEGRTWPIAGAGPCERPYGLDRDGQAFHKGTGPNLVVGWPACPRRWERLRRHGVETVSLPGIVSWATERGLHRGRQPAWAARLCRHYLRSKEAPDGLKDARERHQRELERKAREAQKGMRR